MTMLKKFRTATKLGAKMLQETLNRFWRARNIHLRPGFEIRSHLTNLERTCLYRLTMACRPRYSLEIGSYVGASAYFIGSALRQQREHGVLLCIDTWTNDAMTEGPTDTWSDFHANTESIREQIVPIRGFSTDVSEDVKKVTDSIQFMLIDGDHSYEGVKADWETYKAFLHPGSVVVFHDIAWAEGVQRVVREDVEPICAESRALPNMWWGKLAGRP